MSITSMVVFSNSIESVAATGGSVWLKTSLTTTPMFVELSAPGVPPGFVLFRQL